MQDTYSLSLFKTRRRVHLDKTYLTARIELVSVNPIILDFCLIDGS